MSWNEDWWTRFNMLEIDSARKKEKLNIKLTVTSSPPFPVFLETRPAVASYPTAETIKIYNTKSLLPMLQSLLPPTSVAHTHFPPSAACQSSSFSGE